MNSPVHEDDHVAAQIRAKQLIAIGPNDVHSILDENKGDLDSTCDRLLVMGESIEKPTTKITPARSMNEVHLVVLKAKFPEVTETEIRQIYDENHADHRATSKQLFHMSYSRKLQTLNAQFQGFLSETKIASILLKNQENLAVASEECSALIRATTSSSPPVSTRMPNDYSSTSPAPAPFNTLPAPIPAASPSSTEHETSLPPPKSPSIFEPISTTTTITTTITTPPTILSPSIDSASHREAFLRRSRELEQQIEKESTTVVEQRALTRSALKMQIRDLINNTTSNTNTNTNTTIATVAKEDSSSTPEPIPTSTVTPSKETSYDEAMPGGKSIRLSVKSPQVDCNETISVNWEVTPGSAEVTSTSGAWIGLYAAGTFGASYVARSYVNTIEPPNTPRMGSVKFTAPQTLGQYYVAFYSSQKNYILGSSDFPVIKIGPTFRLTARPTDAAYQPRAVTVVIERLSGQPRKNAWVGCYPATESRYKEFQWLTNGTPAAANETTTVLLNFELAKSGNWEFRLFPDRPVANELARCSYTLGGRDSLSLSIESGVLMVRYNLMTVDPATEAPWVGIYRAEESDHRNKWKHYQKVKEYNGILMYKMLQSPGNYQARLFARKTFEPVVMSEAIAVLV